MENKEVSVTKPEKDPGTEISMSSKCTYCSKKLTMVDTSVGKCKCGGVYCTKHRMSDSHSCSFDYRKEFQSNIQGKMVTVVSSKVASI